MNFTGLSLRLKEKVFSRSHGSGQGVEKKGPKPSKRNLQFDLFAQLSYMSAVATAGVSRSQLFQYASQLPYSSSVYFRSVHTLARRLNTDYAQSCRVMAEQTKEAEIKGLLLRMAGAMSSGEEEGEFLRREAEIIGEAFGNKYERDVESLKKWTDAYVTLLVASGLIVIVAVISMMIYQVGVAIIMGLAFTMVAATCLGAWIIYAGAPREIKTRASGASSRLQLFGSRVFRITAPMAVVVCSLMLLLHMDLGLILVAGAVVIFPAGLIIMRDDKNITRKDADIGTVVRVLGGMTSSLGTTPSEAIAKVDRRSMGSLMPEVTRLGNRLKAGIDPHMCWAAMSNEAGSELIDRTVKMFWTPLNLGGEPAKVGNACSFFATKVAYLRETRLMVASTFQWLTIPLHIAMVALLQFIVEIMALFSQSISQSSVELSETTQGPGGASLDVLSFGEVDMQLVGGLVTSVILVLTVANAFAPKAAEGGHSMKLAYNLAITMTISGVLLLAVPTFANGLFSSIVAN